MESCGSSVRTLQAKNAVTASRNVGTDRFKQFAITKKTNQKHKNKSLQT